MAELVYLLCALSSVFVALLLYLSYRRKRTPLLLWCTFGFIGLAVNNSVLVVDLMLVPEVDLSLARTVTALVGIGLLVIGLIWEAT